MFITSSHAETPGRNWRKCYYIRQRDLEHSKYLYCAWSNMYRGYNVRYLRMHSSKARVGH